MNSKQKNCEGQWNDYFIIVIVNFKASDLTL